jgi:hypothetical protein
MSVRTYDAGLWQNITLFVMVLFVAIISFGVAATATATGQSDLATVFGIIFVTCVLVAWVAYFLRTHPEIINLGEDEGDDND